jgi:hypothetical protein
MLKILNINEKDIDLMDPKELKSIIRNYKLNKLIK